jgi:hypothetical protein
LKADDGKEREQRIFSEEGIYSQSLRGTPHLSFRARALPAVAESTGIKWIPQLHFVPCRMTEKGVVIARKRACERSRAIHFFPLTNAENSCMNALSIDSKGGCRHVSGFFTAQNSYQRELTGTKAPVSVCREACGDLPLGVVDNTGAFSISRESRRNITKGGSK